MKAPRIRDRRGVARWRMTDEGVTEPDAYPVFADVLAWVAAVVGVPAALVTWAPGWFTLVWVGIHTVVYWVSVQGFRSRGYSPAMRVARTVVSLVVWASIPLSAVVWGPFADHEPLALLITVVFVAMRSLVVPTDVRSWFESDGPLVGLVAACCSFSVGSPALGAAAVLVSIFFFLAERGQIELHAKAEVDRVALRDAIAAMKDLAHTDQLTGIPNRRGAIEWLDERRHGVGTVILFDVDEFKRVNDRHGYKAGDQVLQAVAAVMRRRLGDQWRVFRIGGDEFLALSDEAIDAPRQAFTMLSLEVQSVDGQTTPIRVDFSGGAVQVEWPIDVDDASVMLSPAVRRAKRQRGSVLVGLAEIDETDVGSWSARVLDALHSRGFVWWGQAILESTGLRPVAVELLCRWPQRDGTVVLPDEFLPVLSTSERSRMLSTQTIEEAARWLDAMDEAGLDLSVHVNALPSDVTGGLLNDIRRFIPESHRHRIRIEVLESEVLDPTDRVRTALLELRAAGVSVMIDDFGAGHTVFSSLSDLAIDGVKLDRSLIFGIGTSDRRRAIVAGLGPVFDELKMSVIAEGVEREAELSVVRQAGIEFVQGLYVGAALPLDQCLDALRGSTPTIDIRESQPIDLRAEPVREVDHDE